MLNFPVMPKRWHRLLVLLMAIVITGCSMVPGDDGAGQQAVEATSDVAVAVQSVQPQTITRTITVTGQLQPQKRVDVVSSMGGEVSQVLVKVGDQVKAGQPLLRIDLGDEIRQLEQQVAQAEAALAGVEAASAEAELALAIAQREYDRMEKLYNEGAISRQQWEQIVDNLERARLAVEKQIPAQQHQAEVAVAQAKQQLEIARKNATITAPIAGEVAVVAISAGNFAAPGNPLVTIIDRQQLEVAANLTDSQVVQVTTGAPVEVVVPALGSTKFQGHVSEVGLTANPMAGGSFPVKFVIPNPERRLPIDLFAEIIIPVETAEQVIAVPREAVLNRNDTQIVFVVDNGVARERVVEIGLSNESYIEIRSGLEIGEQVVVVGQHYLVDGTPVIVSQQELISSSQEGNL